MLVMIRLAGRGLLAAGLTLVLVHASVAADSDLPKAATLFSVVKPANEKASPETVTGKAGTAEKQESVETNPKPSAEEGTTAKNAATEVSAPLAAPPRKKLKQLSPEMTERRDRVRRLLAALRQQPFNTQQNDCSDVLEFCRGFGCNTELLDNAGSGQKLNGITCLCWNMPCAGSELMTVSEGHLTGRIGYGYQDQASELAAVLALSEVAPDYPARSRGLVRNVADIIEYEKLTCRAGADMSMKLVALSYYVRKPSWKDSLGSEWTLRRVVGEELSRPLGAVPHAATNRLLGLACAMSRFKADNVPLDGELARAKTYLDEATTYAFSAQNSDGSWGRVMNRDYAIAVAYTARMLEWLVNSQPTSALEGRQVSQGIDFLTSAFSAPHYQNYISTMSPREISAAMHAAYVLNFYDQAVFAPADPLPEPPPAKAEKAQPTAAQRETQAR